jgi:hypothetical protein
VLLVHPLLSAAGGAAPHRPPDLFQKAGVLRPALLQVPGEHAVDRDDQQHRGQEADGQMDGLLLDEDVDHVQQDRRPDGGQPQLIRTVAAVHEPRQRIADSFQKTHTEDRPLLCYSNATFYRKSPQR